MKNKYSKLNCMLTLALLHIAALSCSDENNADFIKQFESFKRETKQELERLSKADEANKNIIQEQSVVIKQLRKDVTSTRQEIQALQTECTTANHKQSNAVVKKGDNENVPSTLAKIYDDTDQTETKTTEGTDHLKRPSALKRREAEAGPAFTVYLDHNVGLGPHQTVKYNKVLCNEGNSYNIHTGAFTCPLDGIYLFNFFVGFRDSVGTEVIWVSLVVNSVFMVDGMVETRHDSQDLQGGNSVVLRLNQGDSVWIEDHLGSRIEGRDDTRFTTFSGVFLRG